MRAVLAALAAGITIWAASSAPAEAYGGCAVFRRGYYDCGQAKYYYGSPIYRSYAPEYAYYGPPAVYVAVPAPPPVVYVAPRTYDRYYSYYAVPEPIYARPGRFGCAGYDGGCYGGRYRW